MTFKMQSIALTAVAESAKQATEEVRKLGESMSLRDKLRRKGKDGKSEPWDDMLAELMGNQGAMYGVESAITVADTMQELRALAQWLIDNGEGSNMSSWVRMQAAAIEEQLKRYVHAPLFSFERLLYEMKKDLAEAKKAAKNAEKQTTKKPGSATTSTGLSTGKITGAW